VGANGVFWQTEGTSLHPCVTIWLLTRFSWLRPNAGDSDSNSTLCAPCPQAQDRTTQCSIVSTPGMAYPCQGGYWLLSHHSLSLAAPCGNPALPPGLTNRPYHLALPPGPPPSPSITSSGFDWSGYTFQAGASNTA
jgi:hypothetical protein